MNARTETILPAIGESFEGGIFAGRFFVDDTAYGLIVAPKNEGDLETTKWGGVKNVAAALSACDGLANTQAMAAVGSKLAKWAQDLRINGRDDWYIPSRLEALIAFSELQDQFDSAWYWTSAQYAGDAQCAWCQSFLTGGQYDYLKDGELRARAVRRFKL